MPEGQRAAGGQVVCLRPFECNSDLSDLQPSLIRMAMREIYQVFLLESAHLLHDEKKIHKGGRKGSNVGDDGYDFTLQAIQELL